MPGVELRLRIAVVTETEKMTPRLMNITRKPVIAAAWSGASWRQQLLAAGFTAPSPKTSDTDRKTQPNDRD